MPRHEQARQHNTCRTRQHKTIQHNTIPYNTTQDKMAMQHKTCKGKARQAMQSKHSNLQNLSIHLPDSIQNSGPPQPNTN